MNENTYNHHHINQGLILDGEYEKKTQEKNSKSFLERMNDTNKSFDVLDFDKMDK